jgi:hypothetical protein
MNFDWLSFTPPLVAFSGPSELEADRRRALRFLFVSRVLKITVVHHSSYC